MEMAVAFRWNQPELLKLLAEFKEIPDNVKILQLLMLIREGLGGERRENDVEKLQEEFQKILRSLSSVETVKHLILINPPNQNIQASTKDALGFGTLLQLAVTENKPDLVRLLLEFGFVIVTVQKTLLGLDSSGLTLLLSLKTPRRLHWRSQQLGIFRKC